LFFGKRTILGTWLIVTLFAWMPNFVVAIFLTFVRFSVGWYTARMYALIASCTVLGVLLGETIVLYGRLANAFVLLRRERADRFMSIEAAISAMAHELRQPLAGIAARGGAATNWLRQTPPQLEKARDCLRSIVDSCHRADEIMDSVHAIFKQFPGGRVKVEVNTVVHATLSLLRPDLAEQGVLVTTEYQENLPQISVHRSQLQQVILNLIKNAVDAMNASGSRARRLRLGTRLDGQTTVVVSVQDSGLGVADEDRRRVFEPFFTTKPTGTGLGLSICRAIVEEHGGELRLVKTDTDGTIFEVALPVNTEEPSFLINAAQAATVV
jgi:signal transduction histidine kinase